MSGIRYNCDLCKREIFEPVEFCNYCKEIIRESKLFKTQYEIQLRKEFEELYRYY